MCGYSKQFSVLCMYVSWHARAMGIIIVTFLKHVFSVTDTRKFQLPANFSKSSIQSPLQYVVLHFIYPFWMTPPGIACNCIEIANAQAGKHSGLFLDFVCNVMRKIIKNRDIWNLSSYSPESLSWIKVNSQSSYSQLNLLKSNLKKYMYIPLWYS